MKERPFISVIVPVHNGGRYVRATLDSVLRQGYPHKELIVVDDGSTDDTPAQLQSYARHPLVRLLRQDNQGVSAARNAGAAIAQGDYFCFLDADDIMMEDCIGLRSLSRGAAVIHNDVGCINHEGVPMASTLWGMGGNVLDDLLLWERTVVPGPSATMISREAFEWSGGFDTELSTAADQDLFIRLAVRYPFVHIPEIRTLYRVHRDGMHLNIRLMETDHIKVYRKAAAAGLFRSTAFRRRCFANLYFVLAGSWWRDGGRKGRALYFALRALWTWPPVAKRFMKRFFRG